ncbi:MAG: filamentous hemagglutinin N-terminal domain-containing protein [Nitrospira sp.]
MSDPHLATAVLACVLAQTCVPGLCQPQASLPITASGLNTAVTQNGTTFDITGGTRPGNGTNLFHSFGEFGVPANHVANFLNNSGLATANILGRVTGGSPSNIFGTIQTTGFGSANLFLMNPAGIVFGPNASLNVGGSVSFTTADYLRLADGARFTAIPGSQDATISAAPVAAFGFLGSNPGAITVQGGHLAVAEGQGLSLVGGNIEVTAGTLPDGSSQSARLSAPAGQVTLVSAASPGEVSMSITSSPLINPALNGFSSLGTVSLSRGTVIDTSAGKAGRIVIRDSQFVMDDARLMAQSTSTELSAPSSPSEGGISIQADDVSISRGSTLLTSTINGTAGDIRFEVGTFRSNVGPDGIPLQGAAPVTMSSVSTGQGEAGAISIGGRKGLPADAVLLNNTRVVTNVTGDVNHFIPLPPLAGAHNSQPAAPPAEIQITAEHVELANGTILQATTTGGADAGSITLNVGTLKTKEGSNGRVLISSSSDCGAGCFGGQAGDITIQGIPGVTPTSTHNYVFIGTPTGQPTEHITYSLARTIDLQGTDIRSEAIGNAPGGQVLMRAEGLVSMKETSVSVATQNFDITVAPVTPSGQLARNQGFSRIDVLAHDVFVKNSTIKADAEVSEPGSCSTCTGGPSAGEIWFRVENSFTADNSSILNTGYGRAQSGITKIIKDNYFSFGAIWEPDFPDVPTNSVKLTNSVISVEAHRCRTSRDFTNPRS